MPAVTGKLMPPRDKASAVQNTLDACCFVRGEGTAPSTWQSMMCRTRGKLGDTHENGRWGGRVGQEIKDGWFRWS